MPNILRIKRGTTARVAAYTPVSGELVLDLTTRRLLTGNGVTAGGQQILVGSADKATALANARSFSITGDATANAVSFDGTGNVQLNIQLVHAGPWTDFYQVLTGSTTELTPGVPAGGFTRADVYLAGVMQVPGYSYTIANNKITFAGAVPSGTLVYCKLYG